MNDLISRQAAIEEIKNLKISVAGKDIFPNETKETIVKTLDELQPVTPKEKTGQWIYDGDCIICSKCKKAYDFISVKVGTPYCANCGAKMKRGRSEMNIGKATAIFNDIYQPGITDIERGEAIKTVVEMDTHNGVTKEAMIQVIKYLWNMVFTEEGGSENEELS